jgi:nitroreductase
MTITAQTSPQPSPHRAGFPAGAPAADRFEYAVHYAAQAPSSHNSQPWIFQLAGERLELLADRRRALPVVDPEDRELTISCGAALHHLRIALRHFGHELHVEFLPDPEFPDLLARATLAEGRPPSYEDNLLFWAIHRRRTNRRPFAATSVAADILDELVAAAAAEGASLTIVTDPAGKAALAELVAQADRTQSSDPRFRHELASWIHRKDTRAVDGMAVSALGRGHLPSVVAPLVIRTFDRGDFLAAHDRQLADRSPHLAILSTDGDAPHDWLVAGQALSRVLLRATQDGVAASYLNQPIEVPGLRASVAWHAGGRVPQLLLRLGYGTPVPATKRRDDEDVIRRPSTF